VLLDDVMTITMEALTLVQLETVNGGGGADALGEALKLGGEGTIKALSQSDAPSVRQGINSFNEGYNPIYKGLSGLGSYLNPSPGNGAPGDTYNPASFSGGSLTGGGFSAPE
jgi:hypothetical protein